MSLTNFPNGIIATPNIGANVMPGPLGKVFFVDYATGSDTNDGRTWDTAVKTLSQAHTLVTTNTNSVIYVNGNSTVTETVMIAFSKSRITVIGVGGYGHYGQAAKISLGITAAATDIGTIKNTGVRNTFMNLKFTNSNTVAEGIYCVVEAGEYATYVNCDFYKDTDLDVTGASECLNNGDSSSFYGCTFGSSANIVADNVIRPNMSLTATISGKKARDVLVENCIFWSKSAGTEHVMVYGANATDIERMLLMKNCTFVSNALGAATPAHAVGFGAAQTQGTVLLQNCASVDCTVMAEAAVGIYVTGAVPTFATTGVSVAS